MKRHLIRNTLLLTIFIIANTLIAQNQILGVVNYHENEDNPLPNVTVDLIDSDNNIVATTLSSNIGEFEFSNIPSGEYLMRSSATLPIGDINLIDASLILYNILGMYTFNEYEFMAADVNGNGRINFGDYILVLVSYIMQGNPFPAGDWQFSEVYVDLTSRDSVGVRGICGTSTGDVEGVWLPAGRSLNILPSESNIATLIDNQEVELAIESDYNDLITGFNLNLSYPSDLIEITDVIGPDDNLHYKLDENTGTLKVIWLDESEKPGIKFFGETLFRVKVKQINNSARTGKDIFSLQEGGMLLDNNSNQIDDVVFYLPAISTVSNKLDFEISTYPNPVVNNIIFKITSPVNNIADIYVYDITGKVVQKDIATNIYKGTQQINISTQNIPSGYYLYKIEMPNTEVITGYFNKSN